MSVSEIEELGYYDFMAYLNVPFFNIGGNESLDLLAERCKLGPDVHLLDIGCGTGGNSAYLASKYGCKVTGIDISDMMVKKAKERVIENGMDDLLDFHVGDAYNLEYPDNYFDVVLTVFVSQFLDIEQAFSEFLRVIKPGGYLGINEMYRDDSVPPELVDKVDEGESYFRELTGLPFQLRSPSEWENGLKNANFTQVVVEPFRNYVNVTRGMKIVKDMGGWTYLISSLWHTIELGLKSEKIRKKYGHISKGKQVLINDKVTSKYIGYVLGVGKKI